MYCYCSKCGADVKTTVKEVTETYPVKGEEIAIKARVRFCDICGEDIWDEELDSQNLLRAFAEYRREHGLLQPEDIRKIRERYGLSQVAFARILGLGDKTIARYENGSIADMAQNNLIMLVYHMRNFERLLERNMDKISEDEYKKACAALEKLRCGIAYGKKEVYSFSRTVNMEFVMEENLNGGKVKYA